MKKKILTALCCAIVVLCCLPQTGEYTILLGTMLLGIISAFGVGTEWKHDRLVAFLSIVFMGAGYATGLYFYYSINDKELIVALPHYGMVCGLIVWLFVAMTLEQKNSKRDSILPLLLGLILVAITCANAWSATVKTPNISIVYNTILMLAVWAGTRKTIVAKVKTFTASIVKSEDAKEVV